MVRVKVVAVSVLILVCLLSGMLPNQNQSAVKAASLSSLSDSNTTSLTNSTTPTTTVVTTTITTGG